MTTRGNSGPRALGNNKVKGTLFPPLHRASKDSSKQLLCENQLLVQGDSMGLPSFISKGGETPRSTSSTKSALSKSDTALHSKLTEEMRDLQSRERQHKTKIQSQQKIIEQLRADVKERDSHIALLNQKLQQVEEHYKHLYEEEQTKHKGTRSELEGARQELSQTQQLLEELKVKHDQSIHEMEVMYEGKLHHMDEENKRTLSEKDKTIEKMKKQMAECLRGNSVERQQQLEELTKELGKVSEEAVCLKMKLKSVLKPSSCDRCQLLRLDIGQRDQRILEKEASVKELMAICQKFEKQLTQQDVLLVHFQKSEESRVKNRKK